MGNDSCCDDVIVTSQRLSDVFLIILSAGVLYELKTMTSFFVKSVEQSYLRSFLIERRLELFRFGYAWDFVAADGNVGMCRQPEIVG